MPKSVDGDIRLSVGVDTAGINKGVNGITNTFSKLGKVIATTFSVAAIVNFSKQAIELASDVQEVQNVVDVSFGNMAYKIEEFAKTSIQNFGMSKLAAKQTAGTYMSMAKSMGIGEEAASNMSVILTGLTGDVASFYNISQELASTKLKGVFTGETEALKDLGVVMTEANLEQFALSKGITKSMQSMTQAEKVALRYAYVTETLKGASGDFVRTQEGWANQTRVLGEKWKELMTIIGSVSIQKLTPVVNILNTLLSYLITIAKKAADMFGLTTEQASKTSNAIATSASEQEDLTSAVKDTTKANEKALYGFDEINKLTSSSANNTSDSTTDEKIMSLLPDSTGSISGSVNDQLREIDFSALTDNFTEAFNGIIPIAKSSVNLLSTIFGGIVTTFSNIFSTISEGVKLWLTGNSEKISQWAEEIPLNISKGIDNLSETYGKIFKIFNKTIEDNKEPTAQAISSYLGGISTLFGNVGLILSEAWSSGTAVISQWVSDNEITISEFFMSFQNLANEAMTFLGEILGNTGDDLKAWWEEDFKPVWEDIVGIFMDIGGVIMEIWNEWIYPVIQKAIDWAKRLYDEHIRPMINKLLGLVTAIGEAIVFLWDYILKPAIDWIIAYLAPTITNVFNIIWSVCETVIGWICDLIGGLARYLTGLIDFIVGVFTGDWEKAWGGIKDTIGGIWDMIWGSIKATINLIIDGINLLWSGIYQAVRGIVNTIGDVAGVIGDLLGQDWEFGIPDQPPLIPKLAQGAVIPPNREFLAVLGDQKHGTNIEAPLDTIKQAVAEVIGQGTSTPGGDWIIQIVDDRGNITGEAIISAAERYNKRSGTTIIPIGG